ncbi:hypothetical protein Tco_1201014 [Tanacetum coccineum]
MRRRIPKAKILKLCLDIRSNLLQNIPLCPTLRLPKVGHPKHPLVLKLAIQKERKKESSSAMDSNPSQPLVSTLVDLVIHKEHQQATGDPMVTSEDGANPQLSSEDSTAEADLDPIKFDPNDSLPPQQGRDEGTKNYSLDHTFASNDPNVLADKTHSVSEGLEIVLTQTNAGKGANTLARQLKEDEA